MVREFLEDKAIKALEQLTGRYGEFSVDNCHFDAFDGYAITHTMQVDAVKVVSRVAVVIDFNGGLRPIYQCYHDLQFLPVTSAPANIDGGKAEDFAVDLLKEVGLMRFAAQMLRQLLSDHLASA